VGVVTTDPPQRHTRTPRTGRRPGGTSTETREAIVAAAQRLFAERGFENASMRAIAAEAGVDAALITHFYGSKAKLLAAAMDWPFDPDLELPRILRAGTDRAGEGLVALFVRTWDREGSRDPVITLLRAAVNEPTASQLLANFMRTRLFGPLLTQLGSDHPEVRANLVAAQLGGLGLARYILRFEPLASAKPKDVVRWVAPSVQRYLTGSL
jgi:AcrR family transcriptional regulator